MHENLSKKIKEYRGRYNLTQKELAEMLYVSDKAISKWERGNGLPDIETLIRLAELLGTPVEDLLIEKEEKRYYEYQSQQTFLNLPLMHLLIPNIFLLFNQVASINDFFELLRDLPTATGWFSLGIKAKGGIAIGLVCLGVLPIGILSCGLISLGTFSFGGIAIGNFSFGLLIGIGNLAFGTIVVGNFGIGLIVLANLAFGWIGIANEGFGRFMEVLPANSTNQDFQQAIQALLATDIPELIKGYLLEPIIEFSESPLIIVLFVFLVIFICIICLLLFGLIRLT